MGPHARRGPEGGHAGLPGRSPGYEGSRKREHDRRLFDHGVAYGWDEHIQYSAAKAGVVGLVRGLAVELAGERVRVNGIAPGYIRTAQALSEEHSLGPEGLERAAEFIPMGRVGEPEDIADVIVFLASEAARYITGQVLVVDGGLLVGRY